MKAMILAAGEGTRLRPLTSDRPKPMLPVAGRPMLEFTVAWLRHYGIRQIGINLCYMPDAVMAHFGGGADFGVEIVYSVEQEMLGTAGGVRRLAKFLDQPFVLVYGDVLTDLPLDRLLAFHAAHSIHPALTMSLYRVPNPTECGLVDLDGGGCVRRFVEKPVQVFTDLASAGILVVDPEALAHIPAGQFSDLGRDLFPRLLACGFPIYGWPIAASDFLLDIGSPAKYAQAQREWPTERARAWQ